MPPTPLVALNTSSSFIHNVIKSIVIRTHTHISSWRRVKSSAQATNKTTHSSLSISFLPLETLGTRVTQRKSSSQPKAREKKNVYCSHTMLKSSDREEKKEQLTRAKRKATCVALALASSLPFKLEHTEWVREREQWVALTWAKREDKARRSKRASEHTAN